MPDLDLPVLGTLGRAPSGEGTIVVEVAADGRVFLDGRGPLSIVALADGLIEKNADRTQRYPDGSSRKSLLLNADADLPWVVPLWILQCGADSRARMFKVFLGAKAHPSGGRGALALRLPREGKGTLDFLPPPPRVSITLLTHEGPESDPVGILSSLQRAAGERPMHAVVVDLRAQLSSGLSVPTGYVLEVLDVVFSSGARDVRLKGAMPPVSEAARTVDGLLELVARLKAERARSAIRIRAETLGPVARIARPVARGLLPTWYGSGIETKELDEVVAATAFDGPVVDLSPRYRIIPRSQVLPRRWRVEDEELPPAVASALAGLAEHQRPDGGWRAREGAATVHDAGVTGLAVSAFLGTGYTNRGRHPFAKVVSKGLRHLKNVQDAEGCFGPRAHADHLEDHAAAAIAMVEGYAMTQSAIFKCSAQKALDYLVQSRGKDGLWPTDGSDDPAWTTVWNATPLVCARLVNLDRARRDRPAALKAEDAVFDALRLWLAESTPSSTLRGIYARLWLRTMLAGDPGSSSPPAWQANDAADLRTEYAVALAGAGDAGNAWSAWYADLARGLERRQRTDGDVARVLGSWDPSDAWLRARGRVASTALAVRCLVARNLYAPAPEDR